MSAFISQDPTFQEQMRTPPSKRRKVTKISVIVGAVFLLVIGGLFFYVSRTGTKTGDCAQPKSVARGGVEMAKADCASPKASYRQAAYAGGVNAECPEGDYYPARTGGTRKNKRVSYQCFMLNVREGECLKLTPFGRASLYEKVTCGGGVLKVAEVVSGKADAKQCAQGAESRVYSVPATTVCLTKA
ncbi:LppU/SCO3897 family protein [Saccharothrix hoggarensis]|uniref:Uncharacterized protein n=1 Tax=Saccharothrix hoggarensis TaxID=913853 RepID=A0ABW3R1X2_9PSEU